MWVLRLCTVNGPKPSNFQAQPSSPEPVVRPKMVEDKSLSSASSTEPVGNLFQWKLITLCPFSFLTRSAITTFLSLSSANKLGYLVFNGSSNTNSQSKLVL
ncbi:hypothetical protein HanIR_Chr13g0650501 [Helianthus annuus]|nr:hypothetical protein HanIR_Chr13g0650501 [Helianthus annuus]